MKNTPPKLIRAADYRAPQYLIPTTTLRFELHPDATTVHCRMELRHNPAAPQKERAPLVLNGRKLELLSLQLNGATPQNMRQAEERLVIEDVPPQSTLECVTRIHPENNTALEGLFLSRGMFCTQCEAEGFRRICFYPDRPDVLSVFTTTLEADKKEYPVLLANGNEEAGGSLPGGRHWVRWQDPFPKPCYLFALVAGRLEVLEDHFTTHRGKRVRIQIFVEKKDLGKCAHAMDSLHKAMRWDEQNYGREYDLERFMIVAVDDFNMGAMENKGLNIFNSACVLANPEISTDQSFQYIENVVAHEYFHNWSGNRVTCRDWFQLSLKEGFTVFRDQQFSADMGSRAVQRIGQINRLRTVQFAEDRGPLAHPVQPNSYMEISNFYTATVYEKGAEVVGMLRLLLGAEAFRAACDLYFARHDGQAATVEDFVRCMEEAGQRDLKRFRRWYSQAGTPHIKIRGAWDAQAATYTLQVRQSCPPTPGQQRKEVFHIPLLMSLLGRDGRPLPLRLQPRGAGPGERLLEIEQREQSFLFHDIREQPVPSLLRGFSAPVQLDFPHSNEALLLLLHHDEDPFNRWQAMQNLALQCLDARIAAEEIQAEGAKEEHRGSLASGAAAAQDALLVEQFRRLLQQAAKGEQDAAFLALLLRLPEEAYLAERMEIVVVAAIHAARQRLRRHLATRLREEFYATWAACRAAEQNPDAKQAPRSAAAVGRRALQNICLDYLSMADDAAHGVSLCQQQLANCDNMTDTMAALGALVHCPHEAAQKPADEALESFYQRYGHETLAVDQWLQLQAACPKAGALNRVLRLMEHEAFDALNPNKVRALVDTFCVRNPINFHAPDGSGYRFLMTQIERLNGPNPLLAAHLITPLTRWRHFPPAAQQAMRGKLQNLLKTPSLARDVYEVATRSLAADKPRRAKASPTKS